MLQLQRSPYRGAPLYGLRGSAAVEQMQTEINNLAKRVGKPWSVTVTGDVDDKTVYALRSILNYYSGQISSTALIAVSVSFSLLDGCQGDTCAQLRTSLVNEIGSYAQEIATALKGLGVLSSQQAPTTSSTSSAFTAEQLSRLKTRSAMTASPAAITASTQQVWVKEFPGGSITARSSKTGLWRIAVPKSAARAALGDAIAAFDGDFVEVSPSSIKPPGVIEVTEEEFDRSTRPWYKSPKVWGIAGGVIGGVVLVWWLLR